MVKRSSSIPRIHVELAKETAQAFKQALKMRDHREDEIADGKQCKGVGLCEICDKYERLVAIVDSALNVRPWQLSPVDVVDGPPPPMWSADMQANWDRAREQHVELAKAAGIEPLKKALITDPCRAQANIRWIERHGKIPDGPSVGRPFRLMDFQRDIIRGIYADPAYWKAVATVLKKKAKLGKRLADIAPN
jgi:hypothetical protein